MTHFVSIRTLIVVQVKSHCGAFQLVSFQDEEPDYVFVCLDDDDDGAIVI